MIQRHKHSISTPSPISVRVVDFGCEYIPEGIGGREVSYLHADDGTVLRIAGRQWGYDLEVMAQTWRGYVPPREDRDVTWMCKARHDGCTHKQVVAWYRDELAGLHREASA